MYEYGIKFEISEIYNNDVQVNNLSIHYNFTMETSILILIFIHLIPISPYLITFVYTYYGKRVTVFTKKVWYLTNQ